MSRKSLIKEADRVFSLFIRHRGSTYEYNHCFTCGVYSPIAQLQCGHFRPRRYLNTRWHEFNAWPQCNNCNVNLLGNLDKYESKLVNLYGQDAVDAIYELSTSFKKITEGDIKSIIKKYKKLLT